MKPKPFNVLLTPEQRTKLEAIRAAMGLRSEGDAIRWLIDDGSGLERNSSLTFDQRQGIQAASPYKALSERVLQKLAPKEAIPGVTFGPVTPPPGSRLKKR